jgi:GNAT superfamily N-acetyltransferase
MAGLLDEMRAAQTAQSRGLLSHAPQQRVSGRQVADAMQTMGLLASPIPVVGDVTGLLGDAAMYAAKPEERTAGNAAMTLLGALPFVPSMAGKMGTISDALRAKYPKVDFSLMEPSSGPLTLGKIVVPPDARNSGVGTQFMADLLRSADEQGRTVALSPSSDFGGNKAKLTEWYKSMGFVPNKGRTIDYEISESMYRNPPK